MRFADHDPLNRTRFLHRNHFHALLLQDRDHLVPGGAVGKGAVHQDDGSVFGSVGWYQGGAGNQGSSEQGGFDGRFHGKAPYV